MSVSRESKGSAASVILRAGIAAGILDITYVIVYFGLRGVPAPRLLKGVAAAALGRDVALQGGWGSATVGLLIHFAVALTVAGVFYAASRKLAWLTKYAVPSGIVYGALVWLVMNVAVLPLTKTPPASFPGAGWLVIFIAHLICVGPPIALVVQRYGRNSEPLPR